MNRIGWILRPRVLLSCELRTECVPLTPHCLSIRFHVPPPPRSQGESGVHEIVVNAMDRRWFPPDRRVVTERIAQEVDGRQRSPPGGR